jgi:glycosyltransferase involved in cell wall biosynthesis
MTEVALIPVNDSVESPTSDSSRLDSVSFSEVEGTFVYGSRPRPADQDPVAGRIGADPYVIAAMPAFNEELYIARTILGAQELVDRVVVVDDGSSDETARIAERMGATVISHPENQGYGAALKTIFEVARAMDVDALVVLDSDGQHTPRDIGKVLEPVLNGRADVVIGSRFLQDITNGHIPRYRKVGMKVLDTATILASGTEVTDTQSGFRAYGRRAIDVVHLNGSGMSAGSEILIQVSDHNLKITEVPIHVRYDIEETSTEHPVAHGVKVLYDLIALIGYRRPLLAFGIPGAVFVGLSMILGFWAFSDYYTTEKFSFVFSMGSAMFLILGLLLMSVGLILNYLVVFVREQKK